MWVRVLRWSAVPVWLPDCESRTEGRLPVRGILQVRSDVQLQAGVGVHPNQRNTCHA